MRLVGMIALLTTLAAHGQWSQFRGPNGTGVASAAGYPVEFSAKKNVVWKADVPYAQSSPVVAGGHVYVTAAEADKLTTIAFDARTGREQWRAQLNRSRTTKLFRANDPASPTPAADDKGVVSFFGDFGLVAYTTGGKELWKVPLGPFRNFYGMASSPIIAGNLVVMVCDHEGGSFVIGLDRATGKQVWKTARSQVSSWSTPAVFHPAKGPAELVVIGATQFDSYDLASGKQLWWTPAASTGGVGVPLTNGDSLVFLSLGSKEPWIPPFETMLEKLDKDKDGKLSQQEFLADKDMGEHFGWVDANGDGFIDAKEWDTVRMMSVGDSGATSVRPGATRGQLPATAVLWRMQKNLPYIPTPLLYQDVFYMVKDGGIVTSLDPATGKLLKEGRTKDAIGEYYASPVAADGKVYLANVDGKISVLKAGAQWEVMGVNDIGEEIHATPALVDGRIYVRTHGALYCFGTTSH